MFGIIVTGFLCGAGIELGTAAISSLIENKDKIVSGFRAGVQAAKDAVKNDDK